MQKAHVLCGLDNIHLADAKLKNARVGLMTHPCGYNSKLVSAIDVIHEDYRLSALFACEHGIRGDLQGGERVTDCVDAETGVTVYSLYGDVKSPTPEMLANIDVMVIDLQDVGARFYTYLYSMAYVMRACCEAGKSVVVLDRINPIGGERVEGTMLNTRFRSFVGEYAVPTRYALTIGEFALFVKDELKLDMDLTVVPLTGWKRNMYFDDTDAVWSPPSPNIPSLSTAIMYTGTCVFEGIYVSEGRGTTTPFEVIGAPFIDSRALEARMRDMRLPGMGFTRASFVPTFSKYSGQMCHGVRLHVINRDAADTFAAGLYLAEAICDMYPAADLLGGNGRYTIDILLGTDEFRRDGRKARGLIERHAPLIKQFEARKRKYHLYE